MHNFIWKDIYLKKSSYKIHISNQIAWKLLFDLEKLFNCPFLLIVLCRIISLMVCLENYKSKNWSVEEPLATEDLSSYGTSDEYFVFKAFSSALS